MESQFKNKVATANFTIWRYASFYPEIQPKYQLSLGEGWTSEKKVLGIVFKLEGENPTGSVKDRGLAFQVSQAYKNHERKLVISSSGNAALSAAAYCLQANIQLIIFVSFKIRPDKFTRLSQFPVTLIKTKRPVFQAQQFAQQNKITNLQPSIHPTATQGFKSLGFEIYEKFCQCHEDRFANLSIFFPVSSGTTLVGTAEALQTLLDLGEIYQFPQLHLVQTTAVNPLARKFDKIFRPTEKSIANSIVARQTSRKREVFRWVERTGGWGWVVDDASIKTACNWLLQHKITSSFEGAMSLAGVWKAQRHNFPLRQCFCMITARE